MENLYSVKINKTGRYVRYCDSCWYEGSESELRLFSKDRAMEIAKQMRKHYVYEVTISNGVDSVVIGPKGVKSAEPAKPVEGKKPSATEMLRRAMEKYNKK